MNKGYIKRTNSIKRTITRYIEENIKEYIIISLIFLIGIIIGVLSVNNATELQRTEITEYITSFITKLKDGEVINDTKLLLYSMKTNIIFACILWFMGSTIIGIPIVFLLICYKGFCLGYTISATILSLGIRKGNFILFILYFFTKYYFYTKHNIFSSKWY